MFKLYFKFFSIQIKTLLEYKKSFIFSIIGQIISSFFSLISIYFLYNKFGNIEGYTFNNVLICYIVSYVGFSFAECFFRGFDQFDKMISNGEFDRILTRPRGLVFQVLANKIEFEKIGKAIAAICALTILLSTSSDLLKLDKIITIILMILGTIVIYASLFVLNGGICFFTTQSLEIMNIFTDGSRDLTQYPLSIYHKYNCNYFINS